MFDFTVIVLEHAHASSVCVTQDILHTAAALAPHARASVPRWRLCSLNGGAVSLQNGVTITTQRLPLASRLDRSIWIVPGLGMASPSALQGRLTDDDAVQIARALARHVKRGGRVAASCASVFLLGAAGLLDERQATTSWWLASQLKALTPRCTVNADPMILEDGPITTAGAAFAQTDLMLHLLRQHVSGKLADSVSRTLLIDGRQAQAPYIVPEQLAAGNALIRRLTARIESALPNPPSIAQLAEECCMSQRTLARHVQRATGKSVLTLTQNLRLRRARHLLENSRMTIEQIAIAVGYQNATALRRLMQKMAGANPSRYRPINAAR